MFYKETANKNNAVVLFMADTDQTESRITELYQYAVSEKMEMNIILFQNLEAQYGKTWKLPGAEW